MRRLALILLLLAVATMPGRADEAADKGFIVRWLEENLSGAGRSVEITGFAGALSSQATLETLTIADDLGIWLTVEGATLDWTRSALLDGVVDVTALTARKITLTRLPAPSPEAPSPEATVFRLPELPVAVRIDGIATDKLVLGAALAGAQADLTLKGALSLEGGSARMSLDARRIDGRTGALSLAAGYDAAADLATLDLVLTEAEGGLLARALSLPDLPAVDLRLTGSGASRAIGLDLVLATNGATRLSGRLGFAAVGADATGPRAFTADLDGDIRPLLAPKFRAFFDGGVHLQAKGAVDPAGGWKIAGMRLQAGVLGLTGRIDVAPGGLPRAFFLEAALSGAGAVLPVPGPETRLSAGTLVLALDEDGRWRAKAALAGLAREGLDVAQMALGGEGRITRTQAGAAEALDGRFSVSATGLDHEVAAAARALGGALEATGRIGWRSDVPLAVETLQINSGDARLAADLAISGLGTGFAISGHAEVTATDLARFAPISGQALGGAARLRIEGRGDLLGRGFDVAIAGETDDLRIGQTQADRLLAGAGTVKAALRRDETGLGLDGFALVFPGFRISGEGEMSSADSGLSLSALVPDLGIVVPGFDGPLNASGKLGRSPEGWQIEARAEGPGGTALRIAGGLDPRFLPRTLMAAGELPLGLAGSLLAPRRLEGVARFDLTLSGGPGTATGQITLSGGRFADPLANILLEAIDARVDLSRGAGNLRATARGAAGGDIRVDGTLGLAGAPSGDLQIRLVRFAYGDGRLFDTIVDGDLAFAGPFAGGGRISGRIDLGPTEVRLASVGAESAGSDIRHVNVSAGAARTRTHAGLTRTAVPGDAAVHALDLRILAPRGIFLRGRGVDAEMGGEMRLGGTTAQPAPAGGFRLIRGRLEVLGQRFSLEEGSVILRGGTDPLIDLSAVTTAPDGLVVRVTLAGRASAPVVTFTSEPSLPEDEILSRLFLGRDFTQISPLQALRLAAAIAELTGRTEGGVLDRLRKGAALDDLDLRTNEEGATQLRLGKYISDNIYTDGTIGTDGESQLRLHIDLTGDLKATGRLATDGDTGVGIFYSRDY